MVVVKLTKNLRVDWINGIKIERRNELCKHLIEIMFIY